jgi:hypothetical protein
MGIVVIVGTDSGAGVKLKVGIAVSTTGACAYAGAAYTGAATVSTAGIAYVAWVA